jgi:hypothetical protein
MISAGHYCTAITISHLSKRTIIATSIYFPVAVWLFPNWAPRMSSLATLFVYLVCRLTLEKGEKRGENYTDKISWVQVYFHFHNKLKTHEFPRLQSEA